MLIDKQGLHASGEETVRSEADHSSSPVPVGHLADRVSLWVGATAAATIAALSLMGWWRYAQGESVPDWLIGPVPLTSVALLLMAIGMVALERGWHRTSLLASSLLVGLGLVMITEHLTGWDPGIDRWLFPDALRTHGGADPGRLAFLTATAAALIGAAVAGVDRWRLRSAQVSAMVALLITGVSALGYLYGGDQLIKITGRVQISALTAVAGTVVSVTLLFATAGRGLLSITSAPPPAGLLVRRLLPTVIGVLVVLTLLDQWGERAGWYDSPMGSALVVAAGVLALTAVVVWVARLLVTSEAQRVAAVEALEAANANLDEQVQRRTAELAAQNRRLEDEIDVRTRAEALLDTVFDTLPDQLCIADADGRFVRLNPQWERTLGWTREELSAVPFIEFVHPDDREASLDPLRFGLLHDEAVYAFENRYRTKDGRYRWFSWNSVGLPGADLVVASARDVTEVKAYDQLRERAAHRNEILDRASVAFARAGLDAGAIAREAVAELAGLLSDRVVVSFLCEDNAHLESYLRFSDDSEAEEQARRILRSHPLQLDEGGPAQRAFHRGEPVIMNGRDEIGVIADLQPDYAEYYRRQPWLAVAWLPLRGTQGTLGVLNLIRTVTTEPFSDEDISLGLEIADRAALAIENARHFAAQNRLTVDLRASEERFRTTFDNVPVGAVMINLRPDEFGNILAANDEFSAITGYSRESLVGTSVELVAPGSLGDRDQRLAVTPAGSAPVIIETKGRRSDGEIRELRAVASIIGRDEVPDYAITLVEDITTRKQLERELTERALFDGLTRLANRHLLLDRSEQAMRRRARDGGDIAMVFVDIDHFKDVNDSYGHHAGDVVLQAVADRLRATVRSMDTAARLSGDEFVVLCPDIGGVDHARQLVERLHAAVAQPVPIEGIRVPVGTSIGLAVTDASTNSVDDLLRSADAAMYHAKRRGRNRWELYSVSLGQIAQHRLSVEQQLRDALGEKWFRLHYQPVIDLTMNRIVGAEALLRLEHPHRGLIPPAEFIDIAEQCELIVPMGQWALNEACRQASEWNERFGPFEMAVNLSGRQVARPVIVNEVRAALDKAGLAPHLLCLEMTERVLIEADDSITADVDRLADLGIQVALDDFGTGYSSLVYLKRFPITTVKIDQGFVHDLGARPDDAAIVRAIIQLAHDLNLTTIAEGVERIDQRQFLSDAGCDFAQGFLLHRPASADTITAVLEAARV